MADQDATRDDDMTWVDGNAIVGALSIALGTDVATAMLECRGCGGAHRLTETRVYLRCPGYVIRCPACGGVEIVMVEIDHRFDVTMSGIGALRLA
jgi:hypothetical protein